MNIRTKHGYSGRGQIKATRKSRGYIFPHRKITRVDRSNVNNPSPICGIINFIAPPLIKWNKEPK